MPAEAGGMSAWTAGAVTDETFLETDIASVTPIVVELATKTVDAAPVASGPSMELAGDEPAMSSELPSAASAGTDDAETNE